MATQNQLEYEKVPSIGLYLSRTKALDENGRAIVSISWYDSKLWVQERGLVLPTSKEWSEARAYFEKNYPDIEKDMIENANEWTDSLIAWPNSGRKYASNLNPRPEQGKYPLLIEGSTVEKTGKGIYVVDGGERVELPILPRQSGDLGKSIPELGLVDGAYLWIDSDFNYDEGLRPVFRGDWWLAHGRRFCADTSGEPSTSYSILGFRPARRGLVVNETEKTFC